MNRIEKLRSDKQRAKQVRADQIAQAAEAQTKPPVAKPDNKEVREANANAHVLTHSAVEMGTAEAHRLAAKAHRDVAAMHTRCMRGR